MAEQTRSRRGRTQDTEKPKAQGFAVKAKVFELKNSNSSLCAFVSFTFSVDGQDIFVVNDAKIMEGKNGIFLSMPSKKMGDGEYKDTAFPLTKEFRDKLQEVALNAWDSGKDEEIPF